MRCLVLLFFLSVTIVFSGCTDSEEAHRVLNEQGYKNIELTGFDFFGCSYDYFYHTGFTATAATGKRVTGAVCTGTTTLMPRKPAVVLK